MRRGDEAIKYLMVSNTIVNLDMLGKFMKIKITVEKDDNFLSQYSKNQALEEVNVPNASHRK